MTYYYVYDEFGKFIDVRYSDTPLPNATQIAPAGLINPVWNSANKKWDGQTLEDWNAEYEAKVESGEIKRVPSQSEQIQMNQTLQLALQSKQITDLQDQINKLSGGAE